MTDAAHKAFSFAACEAIRAGAWDEHLHLVAREIRARQTVKEYKDRQLARAEIRAGTHQAPPAVDMSSDPSTAEVRWCAECGLPLNLRTDDYLYRGQRGYAHETCPTR